MNYLIRLRMRGILRRVQRHDLTGRWFADLDDVKDEPVQTFRSYKLSDPSSEKRIKV